MPRSTIIFAMLSLILALTTAAVTWRLFHYSRQSSAPLAGGASVDLGLPGIEPSSSRKYTAGSALLYDVNAGAILFEQDAFTRRPIASITKLMTAIIALDQGINWDRWVTIAPEEYVQGGRLLLQPGEEVTMRDLFAASLIGSANNATLALVRELGMPKQEFVRAMNRKAIELGLEQTEFTDVTGLDPDNISTAYEVALLAQVAFNKYPEIADVTSRQEYVFTVRNSQREHTIKNSNKLISEWGEQLGGSKTGYLYESRYCLVAQGSGEQANRIAVILDSPSEVEHFADIKKMLHMNIQ